MAGLLFTSIVSGQVITRTGRYQLVPDRRHRDRRARAPAARAARPRHEHRARRALHADPRHGPGHGHAGARPRRPERGRLRAARRRDVGRDAVPVDRRLARDRDARRGVLQPAGATSSRRICRSRPRRGGRGQRRGPRPVGRRAAPGGRARRLPRRRSRTRSTSCSSSPRGSWRSRSCSPGCIPERPLRDTRARRPGCSRRSPRRRTPTPCARSRASSASSSDARAPSTSSSAPRPGRTSTSRRRAAGCSPARRATGRSTWRGSRPPTTSISSGCGPPAGTSTTRELLTDGPDDTTGLTPAGARAVDALADARCAALDDLVADWSPAEHPELPRYVERSRTTSSPRRRGIRWLVRRPA